MKQKLNWAFFIPAAALLLFSSTVKANTILDHHYCQCEELNPYEHAAVYVHVHPITGREFRRQLSIFVGGWAHGLPNCERYIASHPSCQ